MDFHDWDWTAQALDDDEQGGDTANRFAHNQQSGVLFVIDCGQLMFTISDENDDDECHFKKCIRCIQQVFQKKVLNSEKDMLAIILYGVNTSSTDDGKAIDVYQELSQLNIQRISDLQTIREDTASFKTRYGHSDDVEMSDVLWTCSNVFANCNKTLGEKKILLFTNDDNPHKGDAVRKRKMVAKATDLKGMGIELELLALRNEGETFDMDMLYKDVLSVGGEYDASSYAEPSEKFEDLLSKVYKKEHKRRALARVPFKIGDSVEMSVGVYSLCRKATIPTSVKIHSATNSEVRTQARVFNAATGDDVMPQDILSYQEYAGKRICLEPQDVAALKSFDIQGLKLIGFKKRSEAKIYQHVKPSHFLYPDETTVKGSSTLFTAMLSRCAARDMVAVCWYVPRSNSTLELVYLLPQLEERDDSNNVQLTPPGFHVLFCPFKDDVRELNVGKDHPTASKDQVDRCKTVIEKLSFPYEPQMFENPSLQKFYSNLEAMALNKDDPDEITDYTEPKAKKMDKKVGVVMEEFMANAFPEGVSSSGPKRSAGTTAGAAKRPKVDPADIDAKQLAKSGELKKLTVADLKSIVRKEKIHTSVSKKAELIDAISHHFGV